MPPRGPHVSGPSNQSARACAATSGTSPAASRVASECWAERFIRTLKEKPVMAALVRDHRGTEAGRAADISCHLQRNVANRVTWVHHASRILLTETSTSRRGRIGPIRCPRNRGRLRNYIGEPERVRALALVPTLISMFWRSCSIARHTKACSSRCLPQRTTEPMTATMAKSMAYQPPTTMSQNVDMC
jgi:hypothetical protein